MAHDHAHEGSAYYMEQLMTIAVCGGLGIVMILLWHYQVLAIFLAPTFHNPVLWGGIALLILVAVRAVALWFTVGKTETVDEASHLEGHIHGPDCDHDHEHGHVHGAHGDHDHDHEHAHAEDHQHEEHAHSHEPGEAHGHDHDHGWAPWRYIVLLLPIVLFLMQLPWPQSDEPPEKGQVAATLSEIEDSASSAEARSDWKERSEATPVALKGKLGPIRSDREFQIGRLKMTCCFADAYPEPARIIIQSTAPVANLEELKGKWVKVVGKVDYIERNGNYFPRVTALEVRGIPTPANQFNN